jgi:hypothetical protein
MPPLGALPVASFAHRRRPIMLRDRGCPRSRPRIAALSERGRGRVIRNMGERRFDPASISQQCLRDLAIVTTAAGSRNRIDWDPSWIPSGFGRAGSRTNVGSGAARAVPNAKLSDREGSRAVLQRAPLAAGPIGCGPLLGLVEVCFAGERHKLLSLAFVSADVATRTGAIQISKCASSSIMYPVGRSFAPTMTPTEMFSPLPHFGHVKFR